MGFKLAAHRGYSEVYPENTMLSMRKALEMDIDMVEMDLHMTADGEIILMHDHTVDRTTNGTGLIREKTLQEICALDAGSWKNQQFAGEKVPTFREFLELMADYPQIEINVELKDYPHESGQFAFDSCDKSIAMIEEFGMADRIYINSWSGELLSYVHEKYGGKYRLHGYYPLFLNKGAYDPDSLYAKLFSVCLFNRTLNADGTITRNPDPIMEAEDYAYVRSQVPEAWVCFVPTLERLERAIGYGAVALTCNNIALAGQLLDQLGARKLKK